MPVFLRVTLPLSGVNFLNQAARALIATIGPLLALEFDLTATELGLLSATFFFSYALSQLPVGLALDMFGVGRVQRVLALVSAIGFAICAMSDNVIILAIGRFVTGIGISVGMIAMLTAHSQWVPRHRVAAMTGLGVFVASFGGLAATLPAQQLVPLFGWRGVFWLFAVLSLAIAAWITVSVPDPPGHKPVRKGFGHSVVEFARIFRHPACLRYAPAIALLSGMNFTYGGLWAGPWLRDVGGFADEMRAGLLMVCMAGMTAGSLLTGQCASYLQRLGYSAMTVPYVAMGGLLVIQILLIIVPSAHPAAIGALWFAFSFLSSAGPAGYAAVGQRFGAELAGRVGTALNFTMLAVVFFLQNIIGWILDLWPRTAADGWDPVAYGWAMGLTVAMQAAAILWMLRPERPA
jgi:predicted MFS family arabinose efflux permease